LNSKIIERKVEKFLSNIFKPNNSLNKDSYQKRKFILLSNLVADLFNSKNSRVCFNNVSSLIILILNIYNEQFPVDIYSEVEDNSLKKFNSKYKQILKEEFLID